MGLGSNVGPREFNVLSAARMIDSASVSVERVSSLYEAEPVGCAPMRDFINAVIQVNSLLCPEDLLKRLQALEKDLGRQTGHNEPRTLDIDVIAFGDLVCRTGQLTIPHPRYRSRLFVLAPLAEIAPGFRCPQTGAGAAAMLDDVTQRQTVTRVSARELFPSRSAGVCTHESKIN